VKKINCRSEEDFVEVQKEIDIQREFRGHPNVVQVYHSQRKEEVVGFTKEKYMNIFMEYCPQSLMDEV